MSKKLLIGLIVAGVLVVGGAGTYALFGGSDDTNSNQSNQTNTNTQQPQATTTATSISSLLGSTDAKVCTYTSTEDGRTVNGTAYFANNRMRLNYSSASADGKDTSGSMIVTNGTQYFWTGTSKQGYKFAFSTSNPSSTSSQTSGVDVSKQYNFSCKAWNVNESEFTPPADVSFQDFSQIQQQIGQ